VSEYTRGYRDGYQAGHRDTVKGMSIFDKGGLMKDYTEEVKITKRKRPPSAWNKFVKVKSKQKAFRFRDGKVNLKKIGVAWRKQKRR